MKSITFAVHCAIRFSLLLGVIGAILCPRPAHADLITGFMEKQALSVPLSGYVHKVNVKFPALKDSRPIYIYTPPGYSPKGTQTYPVIVLLHGSPGGPVDWLYQGNAHSSVDTAIKANHLPPCLLVIMDGHGPFEKGGTEWADSVDGRCRMETAVTSDLPAFLKANFHATTDPSKWAIGGLSEGGFGAANLTVRHPDVYRNAIVLSGEFEVNSEWGDAKDVFGETPANKLANSPLFQIRHVAPAERNELRFYVAVGADDDKALVAENESFVAKCKELNVPVRFDRDPGNHKWDFWRGHFRNGLDALANWWAAK